MRRWQSPPLSHPQPVVNVCRSLPILSIFTLQPLADPDLCRPLGLDVGTDLLILFSVIHNGLAHNAGVAGGMLFGQLPLCDASTRHCCSCSSSLQTRSLAHSADNLGCRPTCNDPQLDQQPEASQAGKPHSHSPSRGILWNPHPHGILVSLQRCILCLHRFHQKRPVAFTRYCFHGSIPKPGFVDLRSRLRRSHVRGSPECRKGGTPGVDVCSNHQRRPRDWDSNCICILHNRLGDCCCERRHHLLSLLGGISICHRFDCRSLSDGRDPPCTWFHGCHWQLCFCLPDALVLRQRRGTAIVERFGQGKRGL